ncbi:hypothetical protein [Gallaecimonas sp. GXIMD4217]|uniref:hypothetical protein n=1 Tax=Gallaecimonas sp. GXIMD4217 TaxID=3131927 RepID=UPI00311B2B5A
MNDKDELIRLLGTICDNQARQIALAEAHLERARRQVEESLALQRESMAKQRLVTRVTVPGIALCLAAIGYLVLRYF